MLKASLRTIAGTFVGLIVLFILLIGVEVLSALVHPFPKDFGGTMEETCRHVERYPAWVLVAVVPMWAATALASTWVARRIGSRYAAGILGLVVLSGLIFNVTKLPYPIWFKVGIMLAVPGAIVVGGRDSRRRATLTQEKVELGR